MDDQNLKSSRKSKLRTNSEFVSSYTKKQRIAAWIGIGLLAAMYITTLVFALTDNEYTKVLTMCSVVCTIMIPIILFFFIKMMKKKNPKSSFKVPGEKE